MNITMQAVFSGPATRSQAEDADEWKEVKQGRDEVKRAVENALKEQDIKIKVKVSADILTVTITSKEELPKGKIDKIAETIAQIGDYTLAPDPIQIDIT